LKKLTGLILLLVLLCTLTACKYGTVNTVTSNTSAGSSRSDSLQGENGDKSIESPEIPDDSAKVSDLAGPWHLDPIRNNLSDFSDLFECYAEFGASMEIRSSGQMSWFIGAEGGEGTFVVDGSLLTSSLTRTVDESHMTTDFDILHDGDEIYLGMHWGEEIVFWIWGDDDSANLSGNNL